MSRCIRPAAIALPLLLLGIMVTALFNIIPLQHIHAAKADGPVAPSISASPGTPQTGGAVAPKSTVTVTGQGFVPGEAITLALNGTALTTNPNPLQAALDGSFSATFVVPWLNVRTYPLVATGQLSGTQASLILWLKAPNEYSYSPVASTDSFQITDTDAREPQTYYLRIRNTGDANIVTPKVLPDTLPGQDAVVDMSSIQSIVNGILAANPNATTDAQKAFVLWQWLTDNVYHYYDTQPPTISQVDAIGLINNYGFTRCWNHARVLADMFQAAGYQARTWNFNGHAIPEIFYNNAWHMYDADENKYYVGPDGTTVLGVQDLVANPEPILLNTNPAGVNYRVNAQYMANLYVTTGDNTVLGNIYPPAPHNMDITLRKNETLVMNTNNDGKFHTLNSYWRQAPPSYTDGDIIYTPDLSQMSYANGVLNQTNISQVTQDGLQPNLHSQTQGTTSSVIYQVQSPYTLVGSLLSAQTYMATSADSFNIYVSRDGTTWGNPVYTQSRLGYDNPVIDLSTFLNNGVLPEEYQYYIMFQWTANSASNGAGLNGFNLDSQFEEATSAIPQLHSGTTNISYTDQSGNTSYAPGTVQITYGWKPRTAASDYGKSTLTADYTTIPANGTTFAKATLNLLANSGSKISGQVVQLVANPPGSVQIQRDYTYQTLYGQTDNNGQAAFEIRSTQIGTVTLTAVDKNGTPLPVVPPLTLNFTQPPAPPTLTTSEGTAVVNGNFSTGDFTGWTNGGDIAPAVEQTTVYNGPDAAQLGATTPSGAPANSWLMETLTFPPKVKNLNLTYWLNNPNSDSQNYFEVWVRDTAGSKIYQYYSSAADTGGWKTISLPLVKYWGNTLQIYINVHQDGSSNPAYAYLGKAQMA